MKEVLKHVWARLQADTPKFWKKIRNMMIGCTAAGISLQAAPAAALPYIPVHLPGILLSMGLLGGLLSQLTVESPEVKKPDQ